MHDCAGPCHLQQGCWWRSLWSRGDGQKRECAGACLGRQASCPRLPSAPSGPTAVQPAQHVVAIKGKHDALVHPELMV